MHCCVMLEGGGKQNVRQLSPGAWHPLSTSLYHVLQLNNVLGTVHTLSVGGIPVPVGGVGCAIGRVGCASGRGWVCQWEGLGMPVGGVGHVSGRG